MDDAEEPIPEEQALDQRIVPFMGDDLVAARTAPGDIFISLRGMCRALGLNAAGQTQRIVRTTELAEGLRRIPLETAGGRQKANCLRIDKLGLWLAGVETDKIKAPFQAKIQAYHKNLAPEATRIFLSTIGAPAPSSMVSSDPRVVELAEQIEQLNGTLGLLREHLADLLAMPQRLDQVVGLLTTMAGEQQALAGRLGAAETRVERIDERTAQLTPAHRRQVQAFIEMMVNTTSRLPQPLPYSRIYSALKTRFQVGTYAQVSDDLFEELMAFLREMLRRATHGEMPEQQQMF